ncbi:hypothetical protein [Eisenibacter elegans]|jgi:hypothetical protein|uniref:hypothetical protein n=1 Tax=Eisenibacter elegans TaxID=997 RepID=UPI0012B5E225|nr:hypothetical protein [Eisenibacter elegans]
MSRRGSLAQRQARKRLYKEMSMASMVALGLSMVLFIYYFVIDDPLLYQEKMSVATLNSDTAYVTQVIKLPNNVRAYKAKLQVQMPRSSINWMGIELTITDAEGEVEFTKALGELYYEFGSDSDGAWTEANEDLTKFFKMPVSEEDREIRVEIYADKQPELETLQDLTEATLEIRDGTYAMLGYRFLWLFFALWIPLIVFALMADNVKY